MKKLAVTMIEAGFMGQIYAEIWQKVPEATIKRTGSRDYLRNTFGIQGISCPFSVALSPWYVS